MLKNRNIAVVIILSLVTCGIYMIYWLWDTINALDTEGGASNMPAIVQFILCFFYVGEILLALNADANINAIKAKRGMPTADNKILYLVLAIVFPIAEIALIQNEINKLA